MSPITISKVIAFLKSERLLLMITGCGKDDTCDQPATKKDIDAIFILVGMSFVGIMALVTNVVSVKAER